MLWIIHLTETDGDIMLWPCRDGDELRDYIKEYNLHSEDYAIIEGVRHKDFYHKTFDLSSVKPRKRKKKKKKKK